MCSDLAVNLCPEKKLSSFVCGISDTGTPAKANSWMRTVVASLRKLKRDYGSFPDVVTPFAAGLTQASPSVVLSNTKLQLTYCSQSKPPSYELPSYRHQPPRTPLELQHPAP
jgi:hypothetical protein